MQGPDGVLEDEDYELIMVNFREMFGFYFFNFRVMSIRRVSDHVEGSVYELFATLQKHPWWRNADLKSWWLKPLESNKIDFLDIS